MGSLWVDLKSTVVMYRLALLLFDIGLYHLAGQVAAAHR